MAIKLGQINQLTVKRETDISYTLTDGEREIFLHFNQTPKRLKPGDKVKAFLYFDQKKRLCATLEEPLITTSKAGFVEVVDFLPEIGVFVNIGISKDILLSKDFLGHIRIWPKIGDKVLAILKVKTDQLVARFVNKEDLIKPLKPLEINSQVNAVITRIGESGISLYSYDLNYIFVHKSLIRQQYRLGQEISVKIINQNSRNEYNGTLIENKELSRLSDSDMILSYLKTHGMVLPLGNNSSPEEIEQILKISKSAFKRAIGNLYKQRLITISDYSIKLND